MAATSGAIRAGRAFVEIFGDDSKLVRTLNGVKAKLQGMGTAVAGLGAKLAAGASLALAPLAALGLSGLKLAADFESTSAAIESMLGSATAAKELLDELSAFAADTPFEFPELADATKKLLAFGVAQENIVPTLQMLGDVAAGLNIPIGELSEIYGKARVSGRLFGEDINQLLGRGIPIVGELAKQFGVTEAEVKKLVSEGKVGFPNLEKAIRAMTSEGGKFHGMMIKQSTTLNGLWSTLKDNVGLVMRELGGSLLPIAKGAASAFIEMLGTVSAWIEANRGAVAMIGMALLGVGAGLTAIIALGGGLIAVGMALQAIGVIFGVIASAVAFLLSPITMVTAALVGLGGYFLYASGLGQQAFEVLKGVFGDLSGDAMAAFNAIKTALAGGDFKAAAAVLWATLQLEWTKGINWLSSLWDGFVGGARSMWLEFTHGIVDAWETAVNAIAKVVEYISAFFEGGFDFAAAKGGEASAALDQSLQERIAARASERNAPNSLDSAETAKAEAELAAAQAAFNKAIADVKATPATEAAAPEATAALDTAQATIATAQTASVGTFSNSARAGGPDSGVVSALGKQTELLQTIADNTTEEAG